MRKLNLTHHGMLYMLTSKVLWSILYMRFQIFVVSVSWPYQRSVHGHYVFAHLFFLGFLE